MSDTRFWFGVAVAQIGLLLLLSSTRGLTLLIRLHLVRFLVQRWLWLRKTKADISKTLLSGPDNLESFILEVYPELRDCKQYRTFTRPGQPNNHPIQREGLGIEKMFHPDRRKEIVDFIRIFGSGKMQYRSKWITPPEGKGKGKGRGRGRGERIRKREVVWIFTLTRQELEELIRNERKEAAPKPSPATVTVTANTEETPTPSTATENAEETSPETSTPADEEGGDASE